MIINEVSKQLHMTPRAIRYYEEKGLISPGKQDGNGYRIFTDHEVWKLQTIAALREVGMGIEEIRKLLDQDELGDSDELIYYLELQRSALVSSWLQYKEQITATDRLIELAKMERGLPVQEIHTIAEGLKRIRETRANWKDLWGFDQKASEHDSLVASESGLFEHYSQALEAIVKWIRPKEDEIGLDMAAGTGNLAGRFLSAGFKVSAVDQSREMLRRCQSKFPGLETKIGNFLAIPYLDSRFDYAVSSFALHHLTDGQKLLALEEMRRVLKPGGRLCIADFMTEEEGNRLADWLEASGSVTKQRQLSESIRILYAIRPQHFPS